MSGVRVARTTGMVLVPADWRVEDSLLHAPDGATYTVGPALYRVQPTQTQFRSVLGAAVAEQPNMAADYVPLEGWPEGFELDNAVMTVYSDPLPTAPVERGGLGPGVAGG